MIHRPTLHLHWTDDAGHAALRETCRLLDLGLPVLVFTPPTATLETVTLWQPAAGGIVTSKLPHSRDVGLFREWMGGLHPVLLAETLPHGTRILGLAGERRHVLLPWLADDFEGHILFLRELAGLAEPAQLHLFLDPRAEHELRIRAMVPPHEPWPDGPDLHPLGTPPEALLPVSARRFREFHPAVVPPRFADPGEPPPHVKDSAEAVRALQLESPTKMDIATRRMRNGARRREP